jgi:hypothetical protein
MSNFKYLPTLLNQQNFLENVCENLENKQIFFYFLRLNFHFKKHFAAIYMKVILLLNFSSTKLLKYFYKNCVLGEKLLKALLNKNKYKIEIDFPKKKVFGLTQIFLIKYKDLVFNGTDCVGKSQKIFLENPFQIGIPIKFHTKISLYYLYT